MNCSVCGKKMDEDKGNWWVPLCEDCYLLGWRAEEYHGNNYAWGIAMSQETKTVWAYEVY
jgi:hypothetical protein